jgi:hypothetical protein
VLKDLFLCTIYKEEIINCLYSNINVSVQGLDGHRNQVLYLPDDSASGNSQEEAVAVMIILW